MSENGKTRDTFAFWQRVLLMLDPWLHGFELTPEESAAFRDEWLRQGTNNWGALLLTVAGAALVWWPTDAFGYGPSPYAMEAFAISRVFTIVACLTVFALLSFSPTVRRHALAWFSALGLSVQFVWSCQMARIGPPSEAWFSGLCLSVFIPVAVALPLRSRILLTVGFAGATVAGYYGFHPQYLSNYMTPSMFGYLTFLVVMSVLSGIYADRLRQENFAARRKLARQALELQAFNEQLDRKVRDATSELRSLAAHLESVRESERAHISRELHDELGQQLTALGLTTSVTRTRYEKSATSIAALLAQTESLVARMRSTVRNLVSNLRPQILDDLGFAAAVDWLIRQTETRTGIAATYEAPAPGWAPPVSLGLPTFRIIQESLTNVVRHSQATQVRIVVTEGAGLIRVRVVDNGIGFPGDAPRAGRMGILGMRERARALAGDLNVTTQQGQGTTVDAWFPATATPEVDAA